MSAEQLLLPPPFSAGAPEPHSDPRAEMETLRTVVNRRMAAAVDDILEVFVKTVVRYREQIDRQRRQLDSLRAADGRWSRAADIQKLSESHEEVPPEPQDWTYSLDQDDPSDYPHVKEEQEELWTNEEAEELQGLKEARITRFTFSPVPVKREEEDEEKPQSSQLRRNYYRGTEPARSSDSDSHIKTEPDPDTVDIWDCDESQTGLDPLQDHNATEAGGEMFCSVSKVGFSLQASLSTHLMTHSEVNPFSSSLSDKTFSQDENHQMVLHSEEKPFSCHACGKTFAHYRTLSRHISAHSGEKPFSCSVCSKRFSRKENLKQHLVLHTGQKPFSCSICGKTFAQHGTLSRHVIVHLAEKPFICSVCDKRFARKENLKRHLAVHSKSSLLGPVSTLS